VSPAEPLQRNERLAALYADQAGKLILYGRALGLGHGEAEDVVHEVFLSLLKLEETPDRPEHYLVRAVRNRVINHRRSLWRRLTREWESRNWFEVGPDETEAESAAVACLEQLPVDQREVIVLKIWHGHTFEEIGSLLDRSPNTVAGRYRYGLERLRTCLAQLPVSRSLDLPSTSPPCHDSDPLRPRSLDRAPFRLDPTAPLTGT
jgi:RNA polymerase sigma-70 factor (ECF subfamily)